MYLKTGGCTKDCVNDDMFDAIKAYVTGTTPEMRDDPDQHAKTKL